VGKQSSICSNWAAVISMHELSRVTHGQLN